MSEPTDLTLLRALLDAGRKSLTASEEKAFRNMLTSLEGGQFIRLTPAQRDWARKRYRELRLDQAYKDQAPPVIQVKLPKQEFPWEQNRPLKPPGRT